MNMQRIRGVTASLAGLAIAAAPFFAIAADKIKQENKDTGNNSRNRNRARVERRLTDTRTTAATVVNTAGATTDTGGNTANQNTGDGTAKSGSADITGDLTNTVNQNLPTLAVPPAGEVDVDQVNDTTGNNSRNRNRFVLDDRTTLTQTNTATIGNTIGASATTGDNTANKNTGEGTANSGDATIGFTITNTAN